MFEIKDEIEQAFREGYDKAIKDNSLEFSQDLRTIAEYYGFPSQANMLCEESAEFTVALNKLRRGHAESYKNVKEELADVLVVALQLRILLSKDDIDEIIAAKVKRQLERIADEKTN